jgi:outer membrane protein
MTYATTQPTVAGRILAAVLVCTAPMARAADVTLRLPETTSEDRLVVLVFDSPSAFGDLRDPVRMLVHDPADSQLVRITDLPPGRYACAVYADRNGNGILDRNFIGIPKEPLGFSNGYRPKGPPKFSLAAFSIAENDAVRHDIDLEKPLGPRGRIGVGVGLIARSNPYRNAENAVLQFIPALSYIGERFQILGPTLSIGLWGSGAFRLAAQASYRAGVYEEDDSPVLSGMGDRKNVLMAGPAVEWELPAGFDISLAYEHDIRNVIGGGSGQVKLDRSWQWKRAGFTPFAALTWTHADLANHDFGVPAEQARSDRPAYTAGSTISPEAGLGIFVEVTRSIRVFTNVGIEFLDRDVADSPIVDRSHVVKAVSAVTYVF